VGGCIPFTARGSRFPDRGCIEMGITSDDPARQRYLSIILEREGEKKGMSVWAVKKEKETFAGTKDSCKGGE